MEQHDPSHGRQKERSHAEEMFAEIGENCYIEPPFHVNFGGAHVHFGKICDRQPPLLTNNSGGCFDSV